MDTELLKTFLEVEKTRHFGKAAENLYLTQSAVSSRVRQLESQLSAPLFTRYRNNIQLTPAGERLRTHAEAILAAWDRARLDVALDRNQNVQISIGATPNVWDILLQERINQIFSDNPGIAVRAESVSPEVVARRLLNRTLDLAILFDPPKADELGYCELATVELVMVTRAAIQEDSVPWLSGWVMVDWGTRFGIELSRHLSGLPSPVLHTNSARVALDFLLNNGGCAYLPLTMVQTPMSEGDLYQVNDVPVIKRHIYCSWHEECDRLESLQALMAQLNSQVAIDNGQIGLSVT
ncbi:HTH-type transcriptional regulator HdfR [Kistimonas scapharcae]|uniref:HTH-type transcriptional regulator HdfR n=1 Tax=Kistimonas scapharcae TaxID=1036133 RepID=A0ABP8UYW4_9GAMM